MRSTITKSYAPRASGVMTVLEFPSRERELRARFNVCPHCPHLTWHNGDRCPSKETGK